LSGCTTFNKEAEVAGALKGATSNAVVIKDKRVLLSQYLEQPQVLNDEFTKYPFVGLNGRVVLESEQKHYVGASSFQQSYIMDLTSVRYMYLVDLKDNDFEPLSGQPKFEALENSFAYKLRNNKKLTTFDKDFYIIEVIDNRDSANNAILLQDAEDHKFIGKIQ
jgi:hypothetical protein